MRSKKFALYFYLRLDMFNLSVRKNFVIENSTSVINFWLLKLGSLDRVNMGWAIKILKSGDGALDIHLAIALQKACRNKNSYLNRPEGQLVGTLTKT